LTHISVLLTPTTTTIVAGEYPFEVLSAPAFRGIFTMHTKVHFADVLPVVVVLREDVLVTVEVVVLVEVLEVGEGLVVELDTIVTDPVTSPVMVVVEITVVVVVVPLVKFTVDALGEEEVLTNVWVTVWEDGIVALNKTRASIEANATRDMMTKTRAS